MSTRVQDQQHAIVTAALALLASGGPQALRVREIAEAAGCTTMTVYSRFGGKDGIVEAIFIDGYRRFTLALEQSQALGSQPDSKLNPATEMSPASQMNQAFSMGMAYRTWALANPGSYQVMFTQAVPGFEPSDEALTVALQAFAVLVQMVTTLQASGHLREGDPTTIALGIWGMTHGLVMLELAGITPPSEGALAEEVYADALRATVRGFGS